MSFNHEALAVQIGILRNFAFHLTHNRHLQKSQIIDKRKLQFWLDTSDAHLLQAAICWSMVFGSRDNNPTHWIKMFDADSTADRDKFRQDLLIHLKIRKAKWDTYWEEMKEFRDNFAAHKSCEPYNRPIPKFDLALKAALFFDQWIEHYEETTIFSGPSLKTSIAIVSKSDRAEFKSIIARLQ